MIIWIASYPKSGNTWLRTLISTYYYSEDGVFTDSLLKKINQFPTKEYFNDFKYDKKKIGDTCKLWLLAQEKVNAKNKLKFFKTHNVFGKLNNFDFTNSQNSIGCLYVVRDPRNVITSIKNHYQLNDQQAIKWIINEKNFIYDVHKFEENGYSDFQYISSWSTNYKSWKVQKKIPIKLIKYEDLLNKTYVIFLEIIKFINKITNNSEKIDKFKLKKVLSSTTFEKLKKNETEKGFSESVISRKNKNKKIPFFFLGPKNDWKNILNKNLKVEIENKFEKELKELSYI
ncbi:MAG: sulfotransferase [Candidatus Pelagibacter sp.]|nr:sulfotransferase [Candidatus Pelagibacter sp.]|tara:strand:- start:316 stop:1173 length:858 start_codon:yes stop_codon:yes gene_type:complete